MNLLPKLSSYTTFDTNSEGGLNPLGLATIAERLAQYLAPGFRERMAHPRYLTAIVVGAHLCQEYSDEDLAHDGITPPWQIWEWYVAQSFVKYGEDGQNIALPGITKTRTAKRDNLPLSRDRYLKSAGTFGFHGVYRTLAEYIGLVRDGRLAENGELLLRVWEKEQELDGFVTGGRTAGKQLRDSWCKCINDSMIKQETAVARRWNWDGFEAISNHLISTAAGPEEKAVLFDLLCAGELGFKNKILEQLQNLPVDEDLSEAEFHDRLLNSGYAGIYPILTAIQAYERFATTLQNAFDSILYYMSRLPIRSYSISEIAEFESTADGAATISAAYRDASAQLQNFQTVLDLPFEREFGAFEQITSPGHFAQELIQHHVRIQKQKPPNGKRPWIEQLDGGYMVRTLYFRSEAPDLNRRYVNAYRSIPLQRFQRILKPAIQ